MDSQERGHAISQRGRVPTWLILSLGAAALFIGAEVLGERMYEEGRFEIELDRVLIEGRSEHAYIPIAWSEFVAAELSGMKDSVFSDDPEAAARVVAKLEALPMIRSVEATRMIIPDGLEVEVRLRRVVACVKAGGGFLPVSEDGVILPGFSVSPMSDGVDAAPLIAWDESLKDLSVGDELSLEQHFDALSVALSMQRHLSSPEVRVLLGAIRIDASGAALASVTHPGVVVYLPEHRAALFGRPPLHAYSGEMPDKLKWAHLSKYLLEPSSGEGEWEILDIRWDDADVLLRR